MTIRYAKDRQDDDVWNLSGPAAELKPGTIVTVVTKGGAYRPETVGKILWSGYFDDQPEKMALATIVDRDDEDETDEGDNQGDANGTEPKFVLRELYRTLKAALDTVEKIGKSL